MCFLPTRSLNIHRYHYQCQHRRYKYQQGLQQKYSNQHHPQHTSSPRPTDWQYNVTCTNAYPNRLQQQERHTLQSFPCFFEKLYYLLYNTCTVYYIIIKSTTNNSHIYASKTTADGVICFGTWSYQLNPFPHDEQYKKQHQLQKKKDY